MCPKSPQSQLPSPLDTPPVILFRAAAKAPIVHDRSPLKDFDLLSRNPDREVSRAAFDDCLSWKKVNTPFLPCTSSWKKALRWRQRLPEEKDQTDAVVMAIWAKGMRNVYDAYEIARWLGYSSSSGSSDRRRRLQHHSDEYLIMNGIPAYEYRILAVFHGCQLVKIPLSLPLFTGQAVLPRDFLAEGIGSGADEILENEIYMHTGIRGQSEQLVYLAVSLSAGFDCWNLIEPRGRERFRRP